MQVKESDPIAGAPDVTTTYTYVDQPAWRKDRDPTTPDARKTWNDYRGYGTVIATTGTTQITTVYYRGMYGDSCQIWQTGSWCSGGTRYTTLNDGFSGYGQRNDEDWLNGSVRTTETSGLTRTGHNYSSVVDLIAAVGNRANGHAVEVSTLSQRLESGAWIGARTERAFTPNGLLFRELEDLDGNLGNLSDARCKHLSYASNSSRFQLDRVAIYELFASPGSFAPGAYCSGGALSARTENRYDLQGATNATYGEMTKSVQYSGAGQVGSITHARYDTYGRVVQQSRPTSTDTAASSLAGLAATIPYTQVEYLAVGGNLQLPAGTVQTTHAAVGAPPAVQTFPTRTETDLRGNVTLGTPFNDSGLNRASSRPIRRAGPPGQGVEAH